MSAEAAETLRRAEPLDDIVLLPLYPHFFLRYNAEQLKRVAARVRPDQGPRESAHRRAIL